MAEGVSPSLTTGHHRLGHAGVKAGARLGDHVVTGCSGLWWGQWLVPGQDGSLSPEMGIRGWSEASGARK